MTGCARGLLPSAGRVAPDGVERHRVDDRWGTSRLEACIVVVGVARVARQIAVFGNLLLAVRGVFCQRGDPTAAPASP